MIAGMAGFSLPKLRWLVVGAVAAGFWAMTQEPPSRSRSDTAPRPKASVQRQAAMPATPRKTVTPKPRPSPIHTASIPRPEKPVGKTDAKNSLFTTARVHLRARASTSAEIVSTLNPGQKIGLLARDGKWRLVLASGQKGWVHGDYLGAQSSPPRAAAVNPPRPPQPVAAKSALSSKSALSKVKGVLFGAHPARAPQGGDCQCPYDLMLNGKQCGDHSAFIRHGPQSVQCYL
ncbi:MAG: SH3 domain-containing protein [Pseudaminobacter sp.]|nr:SH3 domain-containing protein [Pseudaminobacter sp.]